MQKQEIKAASIAAIALILMLAGCKKQLPDSFIMAGVDEQLLPYFERFEQEAISFGLDASLENSGITGEITSIEEGSVIGTCSFSSQHPNHVTIDKEFWDSASDLGREYVVFHELGHCYLLRDHTEETLQNGHCVSIMASGTGACQYGYTSSTRDYYLEELYLGNGVSL